MEFVLLPPGTEPDRDREPTGEFFSPTVLFSRWTAPNHFFYEAIGIQGYPGGAQGANQDFAPIRAPRDHKYDCRRGILFGNNVHLARHADPQHGCLVPPFDLQLQVSVEWRILKHP